MTRETKIGLLVSLAFVIAVGVLLSDHMVNNTDAKPVEVAQAGPDVAKGLAVPGQPVEGVAAPVQPEANVAPVATVPSVAEVALPPADAGRSTVVVGPPATSEIEIAKATPNVQQRPTEIHIAPPAEVPAVAVAPETVTHVATLPGTTLAPITPADSAAALATRPVEADKKFQDYVAVSGDNVARMARRFLGADTKANRDLIIAANDVLKRDPTKVVVGKTYRIPVKPAPAAAVASASDTATLMAQTNTPAPSAPAPAKTYVVRSGDNLWKIAKGNAQLISEIRKLNRNAFKGDNLRVGTTLRLPAKDAG